MSDQFVAPSIEKPSTSSAPSSLDNAKNTVIKSEVSYSFCHSVGVRIANTWDSSSKASALYPPGHN